MTDHPALPGPVPYVLRAGDGVAHLVANQIVRTVASTAETAGGFGAVVCDCPLDRMPVPMHWHEKEHDTWFVTRGRLQVWSDGQARVLAPGDFAYVRPGGIHSYQSVAPRTRFFGVVAPGGWEAFFADAGEVWGMTALPPGDRPVPFPKLGAAIGKHRIMRVEQPDYVAPVAIGEGDRTLPGAHASYYLEAGFGPRWAVGGHLATAVLTATESDGLLEMRTVEGGRDAAVPALRHERTHIFLYVLDGALELTIAGEPHRLTAGDAANLPAGTPYASRIDSGEARWIVVSSGGDGAAFWDRAGEESPTFSHPVEPGADLAERLGAFSGLDVALA